MFLQAALDFFARMSSFIAAAPYKAAAHGGGPCSADIAIPADPKVLISSDTPTEPI